MAIVVPNFRMNQWQLVDIRDDPRSFSKIETWFNPYSNEYKQVAKSMSNLQQYSVGTFMVTNGSTVNNWEVGSSKNTQQEEQEKKNKEKKDKLKGLIAHYYKKR